MPVIRIFRADISHWKGTAIPWIIPGAQHSSSCWKFDTKIQSNCQEKGKRILVFICALEQDLKKLGLSLHLLSWRAFKETGTQNAYQHSYIFSAPPVSAYATVIPMEGGFRMGSTNVYLWPVHVDVWQKPSQYCEVIILQLKWLIKRNTWCYLP